MATDDIVRLAELRSTCVRVQDLLELGLSHKQIRRQIAQRRLFVVHPGVLSRTEPPLEFYARAIAACVAVPHGVLSFAAAAYLHGLRRAPPEWLDMTLPEPRVGRLQDVHFHRTRHLPDGDVVEWIDGLRLTTPARTLFDLASVLDGPGLRSAVEDAAQQGRSSPIWSRTRSGSRLMRRGRSNPGRGVAPGVGEGTAHHGRGRS